MLDTPCPLSLEALGTAFRHQIEDYKSVSFYTDTDQVIHQTLDIIWADSLDFKRMKLALNTLEVPVQSGGTCIELARPPINPLSPQADRIDLYCCPFGPDNYKKVTRTVWMLCKDIIQEQNMLD